MDTSDEDYELEIEDLTFRDCEKREDCQDVLLHFAAYFGEIAAMERLVAAGADINGCPKVLHRWFHYTETPLIVAAGSEHGENAPAVKWLLEHGADPHLPRSGTSAAWVAAGEADRCTRSFSDKLERLRLLLDAGLDPNESTENGKSMVLEACRVGDPARLRLLLDRGASPHTVGGRTNLAGHIPLVSAVESGSVECVRLLLAAGASVHERTQYTGTDVGKLSGHNVLEYATTAEIVRVLVAAGCPVDVLGYWGRTPLHRVTEYGHLAAAQTLLELGAQPDLPDMDGDTPLHRAAYDGNNAACVKLLLDAGADPLRPNAQGCTPVAFCLKRKKEGRWNSKIFRLLRVATQSAPSPFRRIKRRRK